MPPRKEPETLPAVREMSVSDMQTLATAVAQSRMFGITTAEQALVLMAIAQAEGRHPALAARDYDIIQNKPVKKAEAMLRDFEAAGGTVEWHQLDDEAADATFTHRAVPKGARIRWDMARAAKAGLSSKENWRKFGRAMLRSRCVSEGVKTVFPAATGGLYTPEEQADIPREPIDVTPDTKADLDEFAGAIPAAAIEQQFSAPNMAFKTVEPESLDADLVATAESHAANGQQALRAWYRGLPHGTRDLFKSSPEHIARFNEIAMAVDAAAKETPSATDATGRAEGDARDRPLSGEHRSARGSTKPAAADQPAPEMAPTEKGDANSARSEPEIDRRQPPQVSPLSFMTADGEIFEFAKPIDAVAAYIELLDSVTTGDELATVWDGGRRLGEAVAGNGTLANDIGAAYARAANRVANEPPPGPGPLVARATAAAEQGTRVWGKFWLSELSPGERDILRPKRAWYESLAKETRA